MASKFLEFREEPKGPFSHTLVGIWNKKGNHLGWLSYYKQWKKYVFNSSDKDNVFDYECLKDILDKLKEVDQDIKNG